MCGEVWIDNRVNQSPWLVTYNVDEGRWALTRTDCWESFSFENKNELKRYLETWEFTYKGHLVIYLDREEVFSCVQ